MSSTVCEKRPFEQQQNEVEPNGEATSSVCLSVSSFDTPKENVSGTWMLREGYERVWSEQNRPPKALSWKEFRGTGSKDLAKEFVRRELRGDGTVFACDELYLNKIVKRHCAVATAYEHGVTLPPRVLLDADSAHEARNYYETIVDGLYCRGYVDIDADLSDAELSARTLNMRNRQALERDAFDALRQRIHRALLPTGSGLFVRTITSAESNRYAADGTTIAKVSIHATLIVTNSTGTAEFVWGSNVEFALAAQVNRNNDASRNDATFGVNGDRSLFLGDTCVIDVDVYTRDRLMRIFGSEKLGSRRPLRNAWCYTYDGASMTTAEAIRVELPENSAQERAVIMRHLLVMHTSPVVGGVIGVDDNVDVRRSTSSAPKKRSRASASTGRLVVPDLPCVGHGPRRLLELLLGDQQQQQQIRSSSSQIIIAGIELARFCARTVQLHEDGRHPTRDARVAMRRVLYGEDEAVAAAALEGLDENAATERSATATYGDAMRTLIYVALLDVDRNDVPQYKARLLASAFANLHAHALTDEQLVAVVCDEARRIGVADGALTRATNEKRRGFLLWHERGNDAEPVLRDDLGLEGKAIDDVVCFDRSALRRAVHSTSRDDFLRFVRGAAPEALDSVQRHEQSTALLNALTQVAGVVASVVNEDAANRAQESAGEIDAARVFDRVDDAYVRTLSPCMRALMAKRELKDPARTALPAFLAGPGDLKQRAAESYASAQFTAGSRQQQRQIADSITGVYRRRTMACSCEWMRKRDLCPVARAPPAIDEKSLDASMIALGAKPPTIDFEDLCGVEAADEMCARWVRTGQKWSSTEYMRVSRRPKQAVLGSNK